MPSDRHVPPFSAALCRGLIEAGNPWDNGSQMHDVFRGFMPRPH